MSTLCNAYGDKRLPLAMDTCLHLDILSKALVSCLLSSSYRTAVIVAYDTQFFMPEEYSGAEKPGSPFAVVLACQGGSC